MLGFIAKKKEEMINKGATAVAARFKTDILRMLGEDARKEDVDIISTYFDNGVARQSAEKALKDAGIL